MFWASAFGMYPDIRYYQDFLTLLESALREERQSFSYEDGIQLSPDYWWAFLSFLQGNGYANVNHGNLYIRQLPPLLPLCAHCKSRIKTLEDAREASEVDIKYKLKGILYGQLGLIISLLALGVSVWSLLR